MINGHYGGKLDLTDYWAVGDIRSCTLNDIGSTNVGETQPSQVIKLVIIGMNHDDLETPINGINKAVLTVWTQSNLTNQGYMFSSQVKCSPDDTVGAWGKSNRRSWCNTSFKNALPSYLANIIKPVKKSTCRMYYDGNNVEYYRYENTVDAVFLLSLTECSGSSYKNDGTQYNYLKNSSNLSSSVEWWTRTVSHTGNYYAQFFVRPERSYGLLWFTICTENKGLRPAFCL